MVPIIKDVLSEVKLFIKGNTLDALLPPLIFIVMSNFLSVEMASISAIGVALLTFLYRLLKRQSGVYAIGGLIGVVLASGFALLAGNAKDYFLPDLIGGAFLLLLCLLSLIFKKPLAAWVSHLTRGWTRSWFWREDILPAYQEVTMFWSLFIFIRLLILLSVYFSGEAWLLFFSNILLGFPATLLVLMLSYIYGIWRLKKLKGPGVDEYDNKALPPWRGQTKGFVFILLLLLSLNTATVAAEVPIKVTFNGNPIVFDQQPIIQEGRTLVPVRKIFEKMGATVSYDSATRKVTGILGDTTILLTIDSKIAYVNNSPVVLDVPAKIINSRTLVPVRFIAENLGCLVNWKSETRTVVISNYFVDDGAAEGFANQLSANYPGVHMTRNDVNKEIVYGNYDLYMFIPAYTLQGPSTLTITPYTPTGIDTNIIKPLATYDITIAEQSRFSQELTIMMPYDSSFLNPNFSDEDQLVASYLDEATGKWISVPYEVDSYYGVVTMTTNHLTPYSIGVIKDSNKINELAQSSSSGRLAAVQEILSSASTSFSNAIGGVVTTISNFLTQRAAEFKVLLAGIEAMRQALFQVEVISLYETDHFKIYYSSKDEKTMNEAGYIYTKRQFQDADYPVVEYGRNFTEFLEDDPISYEAALKRYPSGTDMTNIVPLRIRELGMILEESYVNLNQKFRAIDTPYTVSVAKGGTPRDNKFTNSMYIPIEYLSDADEVKVTSAHELFHAYQRKYVSIVDMTKNNWLLEASAEYAAHRLAHIPSVAFNGFRSTKMAYFQQPLGTVEALLWTRGEHEYRSARFIDYLASHHGLDMPEMLSILGNEGLVNNFTFLENYLKSKDPDFTLGKAYLDFAGFMMLDASGDIKTADMYSEAYFKEDYSGSKKKIDISLWSDRTYIPYLATSKVLLPDGQKGMVMLTAESPSLGLGMNVYLLKGNAKTSGLKPVLELSNTVKESTLIEVEKGDVIYLVAGNSAQGDPYSLNHTMKGSLTIEPADIKIDRSYSGITRTTKTVTLTASGKGLEDPSKLNFQWNVTSNKGNRIDLKDPMVATFSPLSMTVQLIHENPINESDLTDNTVSGDMSNPFSGVSIVNIDDGTQYAITLKITDKASGGELFSTTLTEIVGMLSPMIEVDTIILK